MKIVGQRIPSHKILAQKSNSSDELRICFRFLHLVIRFAEISTALAAICTGPDVCGEYYSLVAP